MLSVIPFPSPADEDEGPLVWNIYRCTLLRACTLSLHSTSNWAYILSLSSNWYLDCLVSSCLHRKTWHAYKWISQLTPRPHSLSIGWLGTSWLAWTSSSCFVQRNISGPLLWLFQYLALKLLILLSASSSLPAVTHWHAHFHLLQLLAPQTHGPLRPVVHTPAAGTTGRQTTVI